MDIKVTGTVKYGGKWYGPNEVINGVDEAEGKRIVKISAGIKIEKTPEQIAAEAEAAAKAQAEAEEAAKAQAEAEEAARKAQEEKEEAERKAVEEKARKEAEKQLKALRKKAAELGIDGADEKDAETLTAEIAAKEQK